MFLTLFIGVGNPLAHENPFILAINIIFYRWHNVLAKSISEKYNDWDDEQIFNEARKWVVASLQVGLSLTQLHDFANYFVFFP